MNSIFQDIKITLHQANFSTVDMKWSKKVFPYPHYRIYYVTDGEATLILNDRKLKLSKGHVYLIPAFSLVEAICQDSMSHYFIHFQLISNFNNNIFEMYNPNLIVESQKNTIELFKNIIENYENKNIFSEFISMGSFNLLLAPFFKGIKELNSNMVKFSEVLSYIENNLTQNVEIKTLAKLMNLNNVYFSNIFSKAFGLPPIQYIIKKRLEKAQLLLINSSAKIKDIALECGFENNMYFSRVFHQKMSMTPEQYRKFYTNIMKV